MLKACTAWTSSPCSLLTELKTFPIPLVCIDGTRTCWAGLDFFWKCAKMTQWLFCLKGPTLFCLALNSQTIQQVEKMCNWRWAILRIKCFQSTVYFVCKSSVFIDIYLVKTFNTSGAMSIILLTGSTLEATEGLAPTICLLICNCKLKYFEDVDRLSWQGASLTACVAFLLFSFYESLSVWLGFITLTLS